MPSLGFPLAGPLGYDEAPPVSTGASGVIYPTQPGVDLGCFPDLDPLGTLVSGRVALSQSLARRLTTPRGGLFYDTNYGSDLRLYLNEGMTEEARSRIRATVVAECLKDSRVTGANADVTFRDQELTLAISIDTEVGNLPITLTVGRTTLELLSPAAGPLGEDLRIVLTGLPPVQQPPAPEPLGQDVSCFPDLDWLGTLVSGRTMLAQALARRLTTPRGGLFYDGNYGTDLRLYLNEGVGAGAEARIRSEIEAECLKDERVSSTSAETSFDLTAQSLDLSISVDTKNGPFVLTLAVTALTVDLLAVN